MAQEPVLRVHEEWALQRLISAIPECFTVSHAIRKSERSRHVELARKGSVVDEVGEDGGRVEPIRGFRWGPLDSARREVRRNFQ